MSSGVHFLFFIVLLPWWFFFKLLRGLIPDHGSFCRAIKVHTFGHTNDRLCSHHQNQNVKAKQLTPATFAKAIIVLLTTPCQTNIPGSVRWQRAACPVYSPCGLTKHSHFTSRPCLLPFLGRSTVPVVDCGLSDLQDYNTHSYEEKK